MIAGMITAVVPQSDRLCLIVDDRESDLMRRVEVYPTANARKAVIGAYLWTQSMQAYMTVGDDRDLPLWQIRQDDGADKPWTLEEAQYRAAHRWQPADDPPPDAPLTPCERCAVGLMITIGSLLGIALFYSLGCGVAALLSYFFPAVP